MALCQKWLGCSKCIQEENAEVANSDNLFEIFQPKIPEKKISLFFNPEILETTKSEARKSSLENDESKSCPVTPLIKFKKYKQWKST